MSLVYWEGTILKLSSQKYHNSHTAGGESDKYPQICCGKTKIILWLESFEKSSRTTIQHHIRHNMFQSTQAGEEDNLLLCNSPQINSQIPSFIKINKTILCPRDLHPWLETTQNTCYLQKNPFLSAITSSNSLSLQIVEIIQFLFHLVFSRFLLYYCKSYSLFQNWICHQSRNFVKMF